MQQQVATELTSPGKCYLCCKGYHPAKSKVEVKGASPQRDSTVRNWVGKSSGCGAPPMETKPIWVEHVGGKERGNKMKSERQAGDRRPGDSRAMADISIPFPAGGQPEVPGAGKLRNKPKIGDLPVEMCSFKFGNLGILSGYPPPSRKDFKPLSLDSHLDSHLWELVFWTPFLHSTFIACPLCARQPRLGGCVCPGY